MKTEVAHVADINRNWFVVDLEGQVLGRAAARIASILRGKHKPIYTPSVDAGDFVIVLNAGKVNLTGNKLADKLYHHHTGFPGGIKSITAGKLLQTKPEDVIRKAVKGMLPKNKLGRQMFRKLKVYTGADHPHTAQQPKTLAL